MQILVNNAGQADAALVQDITLAQWERVLAVNLTGTLLCTQQVLPAMVAAGRGRIINIASTAGAQGLRQGRGLRGFQTWRRRSHAIRSPRKSRVRA